VKETILFFPTPQIIQEKSKNSKFIK